MLINCTNEDSKLLCDILNSEFQNNYIEVKKVEFTKVTVSNRLNTTGELLPAKKDCLKVTGSEYLTRYYTNEKDRTTSGTLYVYEDNISFNDIYNWYLKAEREEKLNKLLKVK